jgi:transposase
MVKKRKPYNIYTKEFKLEALRLMEKSDKPSSQIALELGIRRNLLYKWKETMIKTGDVISPKKGRPRKDEQSELVKLSPNSTLKRNYFSNLLTV